MDLQTANAIYDGVIPPDDTATQGELLQLMMGSCLLDNGDIWCLVCNRPNECCTCLPPESEEDKILRMTGIPHDSDFWDEGHDCEDTFPQPELIMGLDPEEFCSDCGRSIRLCDCSEKLSEDSEEREAKIREGIK